MSKASPAVTRFTAVLRFLAREPDRVWSLSEIVAELCLSLSTGHALLTSLQQTDCVYRDANKRYGLGSLAIEIGRAAAGHFSPAEILEREMTELARDTGAIAFVNYRHPHHIKTRKWFSVADGPEMESRPGGPVPLHSLWGAIFYAFEPRATQIKWLETLGTFITDDRMHQRVLEGLARIQAQRYSCGLLTSRVDPDDLAGTWERRSLVIDHFPPAPQPGETYMLAYLAAPVFDQQGRAAFAISITGFSASLTGAEIQTMAGRLMDSARKLTHFMYAG